jgi:hypothetical protein
VREVGLAQEASTPPAMLSSHDRAVVISITDNGDEDLSLGYGKVQFCNGELDPATSRPRK